MLIEWCPKAVEERVDLVRIYGGTGEEFAAFCAALRRLASGDATSVEIHALPGFEAMDGIRLTARAGATSTGLSPLDQPNCYEVVLDQQDWKDAAERAEEVSERLGTEAFNWLTEVGEIELLLSVTGNW